MPSAEAAGRHDAARRLHGHALRRRARRRPADRLHDRRPRGRLWVAENYSYPIWLRTARRARTAILIFEDADGDGRFDRRTVFCDKGTNLTGIELGFGGVWVCATPNLLFIPDRDGDDKPDGPPVVVLDGWDVKAQHNIFNALNWGPDGWLWGCNGILSNSHVGKPGHARREARADQLRRLAVSPDRARSSRSSPTARPTPGASTSTTTARRSSPTA